MSRAYGRANATNGGEREANFAKEIVLATDLNPDWREAANYAISLAQDYQARLTLVHVATQSVEGLADMDLIATGRLEGLRALMPPDAELWCKPRVCSGVRRSSATDCRGSARKKGRICLYSASGQAFGLLGAATHVVSAAAHGVVSSARCPVLTYATRRAQTQREASGQQVRPEARLRLLARLATIFVRFGELGESREIYGIEGESRS